MLYLSNAVLLTLVLVLDGIASGLVTPSPHTLFRRLPDPPTATLQALKGSSGTSYVGPSGYRPSAQNSTITTAPVAYAQAPNSSGIKCLVGGPSCSGTKTWDGPSLSLRDQCVLWDSSCTGDVDSAARNFFENMWMMDEKPCWKQGNNASYSCTLYEPPETLLAMTKIKDWMRGTQCISLMKSLHSSTTTIVKAGTTLVSTTAEATAVGETCCGNAIIEAQNVDIYYWPEPGANTSCLSVVGHSVNPLYYGATTDSGLAYWGCTARAPTTSMMISVLGSPGTEQIWTTLTNIQSIITTARITEINSLTFKIPLVNPWSPPACIEVTSAMADSVTSTQNSVAQKSVHARGHSLVIPTSITQDDGSPVSTIVSGTSTFTSPSIYANFHSISAADWCGAVGSQAAITETMLTFAAGDLSTIAGPLYNPVGSSHQNFATRSFNFADLPCPPQSVMEENWYMPAPGEPYRPLLALPKKFMEIDPAYSLVSDAFFTAYDPPKTLAVATAMAPDVTTVQATASPMVPTPGPVVDMGASKTAEMKEPSSVSVQSQSVPPSGKTTDPGSGLGQDLHSHQPQPGSTQPGMSAETLDDPNKQSGTVQDPGMASRSSRLELAKPTEEAISRLGPDRASPNQMSRMESALAPKPQSELPASPNKQPDILQTGLPFESQQRPESSPSAESAAALPAQISLSSSASPVPDVYITPADNAMVTDASDRPGKSNSAVTASRVIHTVQSNGNNGGDPIVHLSGLDSVLATSRSGHAIEAVSDGVSIQGHTIMVGPAAMAISEDAMSIATAHSIQFGGMPYLLSIPSPASETTPVNEAAVVSSQERASAATTTVGVAIVRASVSLDASSYLVVGDGDTDIHESPTFTGTGTPEWLKTELMKSNTLQAIPATTTAMQVDRTLSRGAPVATVEGVLVFSKSTSDLMVGSESITSAGLEGSLGGLIVGGLQTGGPPANNALTSPPSSSTPGPGSNPSNGHTIPSIGKGSRSGLPWKATLTIVATIAALLHL